MIERQFESAINIRLYPVLLITIRTNIPSGLERCQLRRCTVLVGPADEENLVPDLTPKTRMHVGRQQRPDQVAEMFDAVDVGQGAGN